MGNKKESFITRIIGAKDSPKIHIASERLGSFVQEVNNKSTPPPPPKPTPQDSQAQKK